MNGAHFHLIFCHIPIIGAVFTIILILFGIYMKSKDLKIVSLWFSVIVGLFAVLAYVTGDSAAEIAKKINGITDSIIEPHEQWALYYFIFLIVIGVISLIALYLSRTSSEMLHKFVIIILVLTILSSVIAFETAYTGAKIRHTEIQLK